MPSRGFNAPRQISAIKRLVGAALNTWTPPSDHYSDPQKPTENQTESDITPHRHQMVLWWGKDDHQERAGRRVGHDSWWVATKALRLRVAARGKFHALQPLQIPTMVFCKPNFWVNALARPVTSKKTSQQLVMFVYVYVCLYSSNIHLHPFEVANPKVSNAHF